MSFVEQRNHFYFWVERLVPNRFGAKYVLDGLDFEGGVSARSASHRDEAYWLITPREKCRLGRKIDFIHVCNQGYFVVSEGEFRIDSVPFLVTSDPHINCIFCGQINIAFNDPSIDMSDLIGEGLPLVGDDWLGVVAKSDPTFGLIAFGECERLKLPKEASYPEWDNSFRVYLT